MNKDVDASSTDGKFSFTGATKFLSVVVVNPNDLEELDKSVRKLCQFTNDVDDWLAGVNEKEYMDTGEALDQIETVCDLIVELACNFYKPEE